MDREGIEIIPYTNEMYDEVSAFYSGHGWSHPPVKEILPDLGFVAVRGEEKLAAGFLYESNSNMYFLEWTATNPRASLKIRARAFKLLIRTIMALVKRQKPMGQIMQFTPNEAIIRAYKKLGFVDTERATLLHWK
jgi:hypothetical protein